MRHLSPQGFVYKQTHIHQHWPWNNTQPVRSCIITHYFKNINATLRWPFASYPGTSFVQLLLNSEVGDGVRTKKWINNLHACPESAVYSHNFHWGIFIKGPTNPPKLPVTQMSKTHSASVTDAQTFAVGSRTPSGAVLNENSTWRTSTNIPPICDHYDSGTLPFFALYTRFLFSTGVLPANCNASFFPTVQIKGKNKVESL